MNVWRAVPWVFTAVLVSAFVGGARFGQAAPRKIESAPPRSAQHAFAAAPLAPAASSAAAGPAISPFSLRIPRPLSLVCQSEEWSLYSRAANSVTACAEGGEGETWLGTGLGLKRLDARRRTVRHYTRLDGLPGDMVLAVAADAREAWCLVSAHRPGLNAGKVFACRWNPAMDRWEAMRAWTLPRITWMDGPSLPFRVSVSPARVVFVVGSVSALTNDAVAVWDRPAGRWQADLRWPADLAERRPNAPPWRPLVSFLHVDAAGGVWLGTGAGLLRHRPGEPDASVWDRLSPFGISGGVASKNGDTLWLAGLLRASGSSRETLRLLRLRPATNGAPDVFAAPEQQRGLADVFGPLALTLDAAGGVWLLTGTGSWNTPVPSFHRFDPRTGGWRWNVGQDLDARGRPLPRISAADGERLPNAVLRLAVVAGAGLAPDVVARRLPGWICSEANNLPGAVRSAVDAATPGAKTAAPVWREPAGGRSSGGAWTVAAGGGALERRTKGQEERVALPDRPIAVTPPVQAMALAGDFLFTRQENTLRGYHLPSRTWTVVFDLPKNDPQTSYFEDALVGDAQSLWIRHGANVLRYDTATRALVSVHRGERSETLTPRPLILPDAAGKRVLLLPRGAGLYPAPPLPNAQAGEESLSAPAALAGGLLWSHGQSWDTNDSAGYTQIAGYDPKTGAPRSAPLRFRFRAARVSFCADEQNDVYVLPGSWNGAPPPTGGEESSIRRYDARENRWSVVAPAPPADRAGLPDPFFQYALVSVNKERIWVASKNRPRLWEYDRSAGRWQAHAAPASGRFIGSGETTVLQSGAAFFLGGPGGLWRFDLGTQTWARLPVTGSAARDLRIIHVAGDAQAVWTLCASRAPSGQVFAARWDRRTRAWTLWDTASGFPERGFPHRLTPAGDGSAWVIAGGYGDPSAGAYRFDPATGRWQRPTDALLAGVAEKNDLFVHVDDIGVNAAGVWLLASAAWTTARAERANYRLPLPPRIPGLARYDRASGTWEPIETPPGAGKLLLVEPGALYVAGTNGLFRLDSARAEPPRTARPRAAWRALQAPAGFPTPALLVWNRLLRSDPGALYLADRDTVLCYRDRWGASVSERAPGR